MRITVFGATGRTGRPLVEAALGRGHEAVAFARDATKLPVDRRGADRLTAFVLDRLGDDAYVRETPKPADR